MEDKKVYYSNAVKFKMGLYDIRFDFANMFEEDLTLNEISILMSPQHAKAFYNILGNLLNDYESNFGGIPELKISNDETQSKGE